MMNPIENWRKRHRNPMNFWLHMLGIPACFIAAPIMLAVREWPLAAGLFVAGYCVQFLGHFLEGNRSGEGLLLRRIMGGR